MTNEFFKRSEKAPSWRYKFGNQQLKKGFNPWVRLDHVRRDCTEKVRKMVIFKAEITALPILWVIMRVN